MVPSDRSGRHRSLGAPYRIWLLFSQASGIIINIACGSDRPPRCSSSTTSSNEAESEASGVQIGNSRSRSPGMTSLASNASLARIQLRLPITVLISPLWAIIR